MSDKPSPFAPISESVNPQITDAVTQTSITFTSENLWLATAHYLYNAENNTVNAQQQIYETMQAATTMGISALYNIDDAAHAKANKPLSDNREGVIASAKSQLAEAVQSLRPSMLAVSGESPSLAKGYADEVRLSVDVFATSLDRLSESVYLQLLRTIQLAAIASTLAALIKTPEQAQHYESVLETIKKLSGDVPNV